MTRDADQAVPLDERTRIANDAGADLFVSIHANGASSAAARGIETFFLSLDASDEASGQVAERENEAFGASAGVPAAAAIRCRRSSATWPPTSTTSSRTSSRGWPRRGSPPSTRRPRAA